MKKKMKVKQVMTGTKVLVDGNKYWSAGKTEKAKACACHMIIRSI